MARSDILRLLAPTATLSTPLSVLHSSDTQDVSLRTDVSAFTDDLLNEAADIDFLRFIALFDLSLIGGFGYKVSGYNVS